MTVLYVVAAEGGHCRVGTSERLPAVMAEMRRSTSLRLELVYAAKAATAKDSIGEVAQRAARALAARRVHRDWYDAREAEIVASIEQAMKEAGMRLVCVDPTDLQHRARVMLLPVHRAGCTSYGS